METIKLEIGSIRSFSNGAGQQSSLRPVEFQGEKLAYHSFYTGDDDIRGVNQTLYKTPEGRLIVHIKDWSRYQGETDTYSLVEITSPEEELGPEGEFWQLGQEAGYGRPLTLDEALAEF